MNEDQIRVPAQVYGYSLLKPGEIRILKLHPGQKEDPICCTIGHVQYAKASYDALSYEWGKEDDTTGGKILLNGLPHLRPMRRNLEFALRELRSEIKALWLWVDAICINQQDHDERGQQVGIMSHIYKNAQRVIAWLGPERDNSDTAMDLLANHDFLNMAHNRLLIDFQMDTIMDLLDRSYWTRVWVIQELHLATNYLVRCGSKAVPGAWFERCAGTVTFHLNTQFQDRDCAIWKERVLKNPTGVHVISRLTGRPTLHDWLDRCVERGFAATDPRDYIYGFIGISSDLETQYSRWDHPDGQRLTLTPNYRNTVRETFLEAVPYIIQGSNQKYAHISEPWEICERFAELMGLEMDESLRGSIAARFTIRPERKAKTSFETWWAFYRAAGSREPMTAESFFGS